MIALSKVKGVGGLTWKSTSLKPRDGYHTPVVAKYDAGFINAVGLKNPGIDQTVTDIKLVKKHTHIPIIASVFAFQISDFSEVAMKIVQAKPDLIEVNISCPHVHDELGRPISDDPILSAMVIGEVKRVVKKIPIIAKLSPNVANLAEIAHAVEDAGADGIAAINTAGPGMLIDISRRQAILGNKIGGISGVGIKPLALRCVYQIAKAVKIPIIGMGGISTGTDAVEMVMAGATLIGVGSAMFGGGPAVFNKILTEMTVIMEKD
jgi:dihydroorotate dehydrogenase (NAD+) catalytic subunit